VAVFDCHHKFFHPLESFREVVADGAEAQSEVGRRVEAISWGEE
jgi:hypothetical protein